ncbi:MAG: 2-phospho-L-lactate transferase CofD family protein [Patescibacteria group bacterium]
MSKIVLVGGGSGISPLLSELAKKKNVEVIAIVTVFDNGGSTGILREKFHISAVGDFRKNVSAVAGPIGKFFEKRIRGHALGNLALADLTREFGFQRATEIFSDFGAARVVPVSFSNSQLVGELENGAKITGEKNFDHPPKKFINKKIIKVRLAPKAQLNPEVAEILVMADKIVVGPGSLFGSLLANFAVDGFRTAFAKSRAEKILVCNSTNEFGCRGESSAEIQKRFRVRFDKILPPRKWNSQKLAQKILQ